MNDRGLRSRALTVAAAVAMALVTTGCSGSAASPVKAAGHSAIATTPPASPSGTADAAVNALVLSSAAASQAGVPVEQRPAPDGTHLRGLNADTLDLCRATYPSEAKRTARHQVDYLDTEAGAQIASEEVVSYSGAGATEAYAEVTRAARTCPKTVREGSATASDVTVQARSGQLVQSQLTVSQRITSRRGSFWSAAIYQYDGNLFVGIYTYLPARAEALRYAHSLATIAARKLTTSVGTTV